MGRAIADLQRLDPSFDPRRDPALARCIAGSPGTPLPGGIDDASTVEVVDDYRTQVLYADLASFGLVVTGLALNQPDDSLVAAVPFWGGVAGLVFAAPIVHVAHDNSDATAKSLGLRLIGPGFAYFMIQEDNCTDECGGLLFAAVGVAALGVTVASLIDQKYLARKIRRQPATRAWQPMLRVDDHGALAGIGGHW
ncbi:MAG TPA: hypothetical protein VFQ53_13175 [Kofleriaceae bacterium]|nr:hypothetical protein [Kofleriaceae bacterium]